MSGPWRPPARQQNAPTAPAGPTHQLTHSPIVMADLIAQGPEAQQRWRRALPEGQDLTLGRVAGVWAVPWDPHVSRQHAELRYRGARLEVVKHAEARNPIYFQGKDSARFFVRPGEHFVIGQT